LLGGTYACGHVNASANYLQAGWAYLSINEDSNDNGDNGITQDFDIIAVKIEPEGKTVRKIIHPHNTGSGLKESAYAVPNSDGSLLMFNSAWDDFSVNAEFDAYMAILTTEDSSAFSLEVLGKGKVTSKNARLSGMEGYYYDNYPLVLTATDTALGYAFNNWGGEISSTENPITVVLDTDKHVVANFTEVPIYKLSTSIKGQGRVSSKANGEYNEGTAVSVSAYPTWGYEFLYWEGDLSENENPLIVKMDSAINITAVFSGPDGIFENEYSNTNEYNLQCFPNPMSNMVNISYQLKENADVYISVMDIRGQQIAVLEQASKYAGDYKLKWYGINNNGSALPNGLLFIKLQIDGTVVQCNKVLLQKE